MQAGELAGYVRSSKAQTINMSDSLERNTTPSVLSTHQIKYAPHRLFHTEGGKKHPFIRYGDDRMSYSGSAGRTEMEFSLS